MSKKNVEDGRYQVTTSWGSGTVVVEEGAIRKIEDESLERFLGLQSRVLKNYEYEKVNK